MSHEEDKGSRAAPLCACWKCESWLNSDTWELWLTGRCYLLPACLPPSLHSTWDSKVLPEFMFPPLSNPPPCAPSVSEWKQHQGYWCHGGKNVCIMVRAGREGAVHSPAVAVWLYTSLFLEINTWIIIIQTTMGNKGWLLLAGVYICCTWGAAELVVVLFSICMSMGAV